MINPFPDKKARKVCLKTETLPLGENEGIMLGVCCCDDSEGNRVVLKAFSGQYNGKWELPGWCPPAFDIEKYTGIAAEADLKIKDPATGAEERSRISAEAMEKIFSLYEIHCMDGTVKKFSQIFPDGKIPSGAGDCCAVKLLNYAYSHSLRPVSLAEFYHGAENRSGTRIPGEFYPPCQDKCGPILRAMLGMDILYLDRDLVVIDKPAGLLSVPGRGEDKQDCAVNRIKTLYPGCIDNPAVHRLDMDTSGLLVLALTKEAHRELSMQFEARTVEKKYVAVLDGILKSDGGRMELPFRLDPDNRPYQVYDREHGRIGITLWKRLRVYDGRTRVEFVPLTGRTHQLRIHSASPKGLGTPIVGDRLYGTRKEGERLLLHAGYLSFVHPYTKEKISFEAETPF